MARSGRTEAGRTGRRWRGLSAVALAVPLVLASAACGSSPSPTPTPRPSPSPTPTPDRHLTEPATAEAIFRALSAAGLRVVSNNAVTGAPGQEPRLRINATYANWPLVIHEYSSSTALRGAGFRPGARPTIGQAPFNLAGLNILVEFGPHAKNRNEPPPEPAFREAAEALIAALDPLIGPLEQMSIEPLPLPTLTPLPGQAGPSPTAGPTEGEP